MNLIDFHSLFGQWFEWTRRGYRGRILSNMFCGLQFPATVVSLWKATSYLHIRCAWNHLWEILQGFVEYVKIFAPTSNKFERRPREKNRFVIKITWSFASVTLSDVTDCPTICCVVLTEGEVDPSNKRWWSHWTTLHFPCRKQCFDCGGSRNCACWNMPQVQGIPRQPHWPKLLLRKWHGLLARWSFLLCSWNISV